MFRVFLSVLGVILFCLAGCGLFDSDIEVCYVHPTYGQVCVKVGGQKHFREDLTPEQRKEVEEWIKMHETPH